MIKRKIGFRADTRKAFLRANVTNLLYYGKIETTLYQAKEIQRQTEKLITKAKKYCMDFREVNTQTKVARKDSNGSRVKENKDGKRVDVFDIVEKKIKKDNPGRLKARREILKYTYKISEFPEGLKRKRARRYVDLPKKMFDEIAPRYVQRNGGYTRIIKIGKRNGDGAEMALIELV